MEAGGEGENATPSKPPPKKRGHVKDEPDSGDGEDEEPVSKKRKAAPKKSKTNAQEETNGASETEPKPANRGRKTIQKPKNEAKSSVRVKDESSDHDATPPPPAKKDRKNANRPKKEVGLSTGIKDEASDDDVMRPPAAKKPSAARKNMMTKKNKRKEDESDATTDAPEPVITAPAKKRGPRKTAAAKKAREEDADTNDEMKDVDQPVANAADGSPPVTAEQNPNHETEGGDTPDRSVTKDKKDGNKGGRKIVAKEKPEPKV